MKRIKSNHLNPQRKKNCIFPSKLQRTIYKKYISTTGYVFAEVPYCVFIDNEIFDKPKYSKLKFIRADIVATNKDFIVKKVIEVNGGGHFPKWDEMKELLCKISDIEFIVEPK